MSHLCRNQAVNLIWAVQTKSMELSIPYMKMINATTCLHNNSRIEGEAFILQLNSIKKVPMQWNLNLKRKNSKWWLTSRSSRRSDERKVDRSRTNGRKDFCILEVSIIRLLYRVTMGKQSRRRMSCGEVQREVRMPGEAEVECVKTRSSRVVSKSQSPYLIDSSTLIKGFCALNHKIQ